MKKYLSPLCLITFSFYKCFSQDPEFYNTNFSLVSLNPGFAGSNGGIRNQTSYRVQGQPYLLLQNNLDCHIKKLNGGVALSINGDRSEGLLKSNEVSVSYAQYLSLLAGDLTIIPSVNIGYAQKVLDLTGIACATGLPQVFYTDARTATKSYLDFSTGFLINYKKDLYAGAYLFNFNQPDAGIPATSKLPYRLLFHAATTFHLAGNNILQVFYKNQSQSKFFQSTISANIVFMKYLVAGAGLTMNDAASFSAGFRTKHYSMVLQYDKNISRLSNYFGGSWELHAAMSFKKKTVETPGNFENW
jgi:type IX secretion system PorP/SprF family membrane protein